MLRENHYEYKAPPELRKTPIEVKSGREKRRERREKQRKIKTPRY